MLAQSFGRCHPLCRRGTHLLRRFLPFDSLRIRAREEEIESGLALANGGALLISGSLLQLPSQTVPLAEALQILQLPRLRDRH
jgi:hypothetical protein|tara:strand:+ start:906 stop:1154 length:249 start_codon:yes stop_codon:yes gene_type:complete